MPFQRPRCRAGVSGPLRNSGGGCRLGASLLVAAFVLLALVPEKAFAGENDGKLNLPYPTEAVEEDAFPATSRGNDVGAETTVDSRVDRLVAGSTARGFSGRSSVGALLLVSSLLAIYGATRWLQSGWAAVEARAVAGERHDQLKGTMSEYEARLKLSEQLSKQLAEKTAGTAQLQGEVDAAAKQVEEMEKLLVAELTSQVGEGADAGALLKILLAEATALEEETKVLRARLEATGPFVETPAPGSKLEEVREVQKQVVQKRKELLEKKAFQTLLEAKWGEALRKDGKEVLAAIEETSKEVERLRQRKLQLRMESIEATKDAIAYGPSEQTKEALEAKVEELQNEVDAKRSANLDAETMLLIQESQFQETEQLVAELQAKVEAARAKEEKLVKSFQEKKQKFFEKMEPVNLKLRELGRDAACIGSVCKDRRNKVMDKTQDESCKELVGEAITAHGKLEGMRMSYATAIQEVQKQTYEEQIEAIQKQAADPEATELEKAFFERRVAQLKAKIDSGLKEILEEAEKCDKDMIFTLEAKALLRHGASLTLAAALREELKKNPGNKELETKLLRAQLLFEDARLAMLQDLDMAAELVAQSSFGRELHLLLVQKKTEQQIVSSEHALLSKDMAEALSRLDTSKRRRSLVRRGLLAYKAAEGSNSIQPPALRIEPVDLKIQLMNENTLIKFYTVRIDRLQELLKDAQTRTWDKLAEAKALWEETAGIYEKKETRLAVLGADELALDARFTPKEDLESLEDFKEESGIDLDMERLLADVVDDPFVSDQDLLGVEEADDTPLRYLIAEGQNAIEPVTFRELGIDLSDAEDGEEGESATVGDSGPTEKGESSASSGDEQTSAGQDGSTSEGAEGDKGVAEGTKSESSEQ
ncbi:hypothetical protein Efla_007364 [Eimeria flavescens]